LPSPAEIFHRKISRAESLVTLLNAPDAVKAPSVKAVRGDPKIKAAGIAPHPPQGIIGVELGQELPPPRCDVHPVCERGFVRFGCSAIDSVRSHLALQPHVVLDFLRVAKQSVNWCIPYL
jgi:hypothetical protein